MGERIFFVKQLVKLIDKNEIHTIKVHGKEFAEVVRCKDCKYSIECYSDGDCYCYCRIPGKDMIYIGNRWDFFCADGERKERIKVKPRRVNETSRRHHKAQRSRP